ncbi:TPA: hypothetical protein ACGYRP_001766 [Streptococcus pyogenes]|uniref:hypothetical protein n=1 Tax=Streptococcus pyogenes TaxID=1314 RepID=UPI0010EE782A|nr:hypothetical protein [Streptococcus pyogenes]VGU07708.1 plasmid stabilization system toxin protein, RelE/ParE family protein [Streptococcus pyogenes]VGV86196.1 plasmid stabilization system toxin protein, RelE/ParE family protein [Streptococcus pyogenes]VGV93612.1 plasmid stabilization system toxin protein, RelE/ParE family protein [Streptococcus pyogenes]VGW19938.1 plasmid stabilization system toxin protein, RelE/ParE family protein [Streptococcus pyogenes]VGW94002.1 plasmid stabilization s
MSKVILNILKRAEEYIDDVYCYIADEPLSSQVALKLFNNIAEAIQTLEVFSDRCSSDRCSIVEFSYWESRLGDR